jgi:hypothetical protein
MKLSTTAREKIMSSRGTISSPVENRISAQVLSTLPQEEQGDRVLSIFHAIDLAGITKV